MSSCHWLFNACIVKYSRHDGGKEPPDAHVLKLTMLLGNAALAVPNFFH